MKILFFANTDWFIYNFNRALALELADRGHEVVMVSPPGLYSDRFSKIGFRWHAAPMSRRTLNPLRELLLLFWLYRLFKIEKPDIVHNFTIKCVLLGSMAAWLANVASCVNELTGLGYVFTGKGIKTGIIRRVVLFLFRFVLTRRNYSLLLLNKSDFEFFKKLELVSPKSLHLVLGVGVDCDYYIPVKTRKNEKFRVALPARMLWDKGVGEYVNSAEILKTQGKDIEFWLVGDIDTGNPTSIDKDILIGWVESGLVKWLGHVEDMRDVYSAVSVIVLPSYREGLPTSLTEAAACGLPLIATDVPGCSDVVFDGLNGMLVNVKNSAELASAIEQLSEDPILCQRYGEASREIALAIFDKNIIFQQRLHIYNELFSCLDK